MKRYYLSVDAVDGSNVERTPWVRTRNGEERRVNMICVDVPPKKVEIEKPLGLGKDCYYDGTPQFPAKWCLIRKIVRINRHHSVEGYAVHDAFCVPKGSDLAHKVQKIYTDCYNYHQEIAAVLGHQDSDDIPDLPEDASGRREYIMLMALKQWFNQAHIVRTINEIRQSKVR